MARPYAIRVLSSISTVQDAVLRRTGVCMMRLVGLAAEADVVTDEETGRAKLAARCIGLRRTCDQPSWANAIGLVFYV